MYLYLFGLFGLFSSLALADDFDFLEETPEEESNAVDPIDYWPHKILLDSQAKSLMLVWFDDQQPRIQKIPFDNVEKIWVLPKQKGLPNELHIQLNDQTRFVAATGFGNLQQPSLLMSALIGVSVQTDNDTAGFFIRGMRRKSPALVVGSIKSPDATKPSAKLIDDEAIHQSAVGELLGEDFTIKTAKGKLNKTSVDMEIKRNMTRFRGCYQRALGRAPDLQGSILIQFSISTGGKVAGARVESSTMKNANVERCLLRHMYGLKFEEPVGGSVVFSYPFTFTKL